MQYPGSTTTTTTPSDDYEKMLVDGIPLYDGESFDMLTERCALIEVESCEIKT